MRLLGDIVRKNARRNPEKVGLIFEDKELTFGEINRRVNRLANSMLKLGIRKGDHVAILANNCPQYLEFYFASANIGAIPVGVNYRLVDRELEYVINDSESKLLVVSTRYGSTTGSIRKNLAAEHYISVDGDIEGMHEYESLIASASDSEPSIQADENDVALQMYTSGTTGKPKGAMLTHRNMLSAFAGIALCTSSKPDSRFYTPAPLYHMAATAACMVSWIMGATMVLSRDFVPIECLQIIQDRKITHCCLVPAMVIFCLRVPDVEKYDFSSLEMLIAGASPFPIQPLKQTVKVFGCGLGQVFGQTEASGFMTFLGPEYHVLPSDERQERIMKSAGKEMWQNEVRVVDDEDNDVKPGEVGEVIGRGPNNMAGYWKLPEASAEALRDGWLRTGDLGTVDEEGFIYIVDRKKDMIVSGAENIYPAEIEAVLMEHPAIAETAVIGVPHEMWGESVKAIVVLKDDAKTTEDEIINHCRRHLGGFKIPRSVDFIVSLPRNPSGKILKAQLREKYWKGHEKKVH